MFLFLTDLQTRQMRILQLHVMFLVEVFGHRAFHRLTTFELERKSMSTQAMQRVSLLAITYVWYCAGLRVTLQTRYLRFILPQ